MGVETTNLCQRFLEEINKRDNFFLLNHDDNNIEFLVKDYIKFFDEELAQRVLSFWSFKNCSCDINLIKKLLTSAFIDRKLKIMVYSGFKIERTDWGCGALIHPFDYNGECAGFLKKPESRYRSMGNIDFEIRRKLENYDIESAVDLCNEFVSCINMTDSLMFTHFVEELSNTKEPCIMIPNGMCVTCGEAILSCD